MCVAVAAWVGVAVAVAGAAVSATAAAQQGKTAREAAEANADFQRKTAVSVEQQGAEAASAKKMEAQRLTATQVAAAGAGGVDPFTGSPLAIESETIQYGELDYLRIINNAQRTAWGYNTQGAITDYTGQQAQRAGNLNAGATLLGGASRAFYGYNQAMGSNPVT